MGASYWDKNPQSTLIVWLVILSVLGALVYWVVSTHDVLAWLHNAWVSYGPVNDGP